MNLRKNILKLFNKLFSKTFQLNHWKISNKPQLVFDSNSFFHSTKQTLGTNQSTTNNIKKYENISKAALVIARHLHQNSPALYVHAEYVKHT